MSMYGYIARSDLEIAMESHALEAASNQFIPVHFSHDPPPYQTPNFLDFSPSVDKHPIKVLPHTPIDRVLGLFQGLGLRYVLVMSHKGTLLGLIKKKDILTIHTTTQRRRYEYSLMDKLRCTTNINVVA